MDLASALEPWWVQTAGLPLAGLALTIVVRLCLTKTGDTWRWNLAEAWSVAADLLITNALTLTLLLSDASRDIRRLTGTIGRSDDRVATNAILEKLREQLTEAELRQSNAALLLAGVLLLGALTVVAIHAWGFEKLAPRRRNATPVRPAMRWWRGVILPNACAFVIFVTSLAVVAET